MGHSKLNHLGTQGTFKNTYERRLCLFCFSFTNCATALRLARFCNASTPFLKKNVQIRLSCLCTFMIQFHELRNRSSTSEILQRFNCVLVVSECIRNTVKQIRRILIVGCVTARRSAAHACMHAAL